MASAWPESGDRSRSRSSGRPPRSGPLEIETADRGRGRGARSDEARRVSHHVETVEAGVGVERSTSRPPSAQARQPLLPRFAWWMQRTVPRRPKPVGGRGRRPTAGARTPHSGAERDDPDSRCTVHQPSDPNEGQPSARRAGRLERWTLAPRPRPLGSPSRPPTEKDATKSVVPSQGMFGCSQVRYASRSPVGEKRGVLTKS